VTVRDSNDSPVVLDISSVTLESAPNRRLVTHIAMYDRWSARDLLPSGGGPPGSVCLDLWTRADSTARAPDYIACATPSADGRRLLGSLMRDGGHGLPRRVAHANVILPDRRSVELRFPWAPISGSHPPRAVRFAAEAAQAVGCPRPRGCVDRAPNGARSARFVPAAT
jgi:hypothetical protein